MNVPTRPEPPRVSSSPSRPEPARIQPVRPAVPVSSPTPIQSIRQQPEKNSSKEPETIRNNSPEPEKRIVLPPQSEVKPRAPLPIVPYKKVGKVGRQRKYDEVGERGENPIREVVVYRHVRGKQYPALSKDMKRWYEFFYFVSPTAGEKPFNANTTYEQHQEAYERGRKWIAAHEAETTSSSPVGDRRIVDIEARRAVR